jgi:hypothetical protein
MDSHIQQMKYTLFLLARASSKEKAAPAETGYISFAVCGYP